MTNIKPPKSGNKISLISKEIQYSLRFFNDELGKLR